VSLPTYVLLLTSQIRPEIAAFDQFFSRLLIGLVIFEYFADQQQWNYHEAKQEYQKTAKVPEGWTRAQMDRGFNTTGLWGHSRHPNFAAEQAIWLVLYQWACFKSETFWNYTAFGAIG
jgi:steroid 5-alpha reductase family enzyme